MKRNPLWAPLLFLCILISGLTTGCKELDKINEISINEVNLSDLPDGSYEWYENYKLVTARVVVSIKDARIADIQLAEHKHGPKHGAEAILPRVLASQSLIVDAVTGSTYSSKVILKAIENALTQNTL
jgi:uncharacterized protein with FMN-binding domain